MPILLLCLSEQLRNIVFEMKMTISGLATLQYKRNLLSIYRRTRMLIKSATGKKKARTTTVYARQQNLLQLLIYCLSGTKMASDKQLISKRYIRKRHSQ